MEAMAGAGGAAARSAVDVGSFMGAAVGMGKAVSSGKLAVSKEGGEALISALEEIQHWYTSRVFDLERIGKAPHIGGTVAAGVVSPHMERTASDAKGYITQLKAFVQAIDKFKDSINQAMAAYDHTEASNKSVVDKSGSGLHGA